MPEIIKLFGSTKSKISKDKNDEELPHLVINEVVLAHCNIVNNDSQEGSRFLYILVPNKSFGQLLVVAPTNYIF